MAEKSKKSDMPPANPAYYVGDVCTANPAHGRLRYKSTTHCVECKKIATRLSQQVQKDNGGRSRRGELKRNPKNYSHPVLVLGDANSALTWIGRPIWRNAL